MPKRLEHTFKFSARTIAEAAHRQMDYHLGRVAFWRAEYDKSVLIVEKTIGAKLVKYEVTGGYRVDVQVDYGDPLAYKRMQESYNKLESHGRSANQFLSDFTVYSTQGDREYEMAVDDVQYYKLDGRSNED